MNDKVTVREKIFFGFGNAGCNVIWMVVSSFLALYYTDSVGISAAAVGTIMLVTRILDGVSDLAMGAIIDRTHSRWGKARPWLLISAPFMAIGLVLLFAVPSSLSMDGKVIYAFLTYTFLAVVVYTACNLACTTLLSFITADQKVRTLMSSIGYFIAMIAVLAVSYGVMPLVEKVGWTVSAVIFGIIGMILILLTFWGTKERSTGDEVQKKQKLPIKTSVKALFQNKYFILCTLLFLTNYIANGAMGGAAVYYAKDVLGNVGAVGLLVTCSTLPGMIGVVLLPKLANKIGKWKCLMGGYVLQLIGYVMIMIMPSSLSIVLPAIIIKGIGALPITALMFALVADVVDYGERKTGTRIDGMTYSATSFGMKVGTGIGTAVLGWVLAFGGYNGSLAAQSETAVTSIISLYAYIPFALTVVGTVILYFTNLDKVSPNEKRSENKA